MRVSYIHCDVLVFACSKRFTTTVACERNMSSSSITCTLLLTVPYALRGSWYRVTYFMHQVGVCIHSDATDAGHFSRLLLLRTHLHIKYDMSTPLLLLHSVLRTTRKTCLFVVFSGWFRRLLASSCHSLGAVNLAVSSCRRHFNADTPSINALLSLGHVYPVHSLPLQYLGGGTNHRRNVDKTNGFSSSCKLQL